MDTAVLLPISNTPGYYLFYCPGCKESHRINTNPANPGACWTLTGTPEKPTIRASVLVRSGHHVPGGTAKDGRCWCDYHRENPGSGAPHCSVCHSFVTDGQIQFLADCTHELAGQTVALQPV
ncbi:DUF6527 family protein [Hymenobacter sediminicola]|uniref:Ammonia monooxygenase n=1 Tax=Hymenobacter sediminicola TaxID=2761579 RepID=A0A7G7W323_9BACT|nr:DUF6527 family protein [Hymenobacter sediminicola]QNH60766.1 ammonia monooxygenase [Hymenobacter sediminicola]